MVTGVCGHAQLLHGCWEFKPKPSCLHGSLYALNHLFSPRPGPRPGYYLINFELGSHCTVWACLVFIILQPQPPDSGKNVPPHSVSDCCFILFFKKTFLKKIMRLIVLPAYMCITYVYYL